MAEQKFYINKIINLINGKIYIGITKNPELRKRQHFRQRNSKWNSLISQAIDKYSAKNFQFNVICIGSKNYIEELEKKAIREYATLVPLGYNIQLGGTVNSGGYKINNRVNDVPIFVKGFWFPNLRTCAEKLNVDKTTILKWKKEGNAGTEKRTRRLRKDSKEKFCYVGGFWFPTLTKASDSLNLSRATLTKRIKAGYIEQQDNKSSFRGINHPSSVPVIVDGIRYQSILEAAQFSGYSYRTIHYRLQTKKEGFLFAE